MKASQTFRPLAAFAAFLALSLPAAAAPFAQWFDVALPDGSAARIWGEGDEFDAHFRTEDGRTVVFNGTAGRYEYVEKDGATGALRGVGVFLGDEAAKADVLAALPAGDLYDTSDAHVAEVAAKAEAWDEAMGVSKSWEELKEKNERARAAGAEGPLRTQTTVGTMVGPDVHHHRLRRGGRAVRRHPRRRIGSVPAGPVRRPVAVRLIDRLARRHEAAKARVPSGGLCFRTEFGRMASMRRGCAAGVSI